MEKNKRGWSVEVRVDTSASPDTPDRDWCLVDLELDGERDAIGT